MELKNAEIFHEGHNNLAKLNIIASNIRVYVFK
jgi:hypothetical protein